MTEQRMKNKSTWQNSLMHDATGVGSADPMLVDYLLAKIDAPLRDALLHRYRDQQRPNSSAKDRSQILSGLRAIRAVIVKDTIIVSVAPYRRTINARDYRVINEKIRVNAGLSWRDYQELAERIRQ